MRVNTDNLKDRIARAKRGNNGEITSPKVLADLALQRKIRRDFKQIEANKQFNDIMLKFVTA